MHDGMEQSLKQALSDARNIKAYFQPILALDRREIIGYEVLGRIKCGERIQSLGPFFTNPDVSPEEQLRVDLQIRQDALAKLASSGHAAKLFINIKPSWMFYSRQSKEDSLTLKILDQYGIKPEQVVIEITEDSFTGSIKLLDRLVEKYRQKGCLIAIDDIGTGFSNMDRIVAMKPDIIKADIHMMKKSATNYNYYGALLSFSILAEQIGASFLIEGVETEEDLRRAIAIGARYVQGYLFSPAVADFQEDNSFAALMDQSMSAYRANLLQDEQSWELFCAQIMSDLKLAERPCFRRDARTTDQERSKSADSYIAELLPLLNWPCVCVYICDTDGLQISSNHELLADHTWEKQTEFYGINWSWRPNFISSMLACKGKRKGYLSRSYIDLISQRNTRTFSTMLANGTIFMIDINVDTTTEVFRV